MNLPKISTEPAVVVGTLVAFAGALLYLLAAFGLNVTDDQRSAILGMIAPTVVLVLVVALIVRQLVTPNAKVVERLDNGIVIAGEAAEFAEPGEQIRAAGSLPAGTTPAGVDIGDSRPQNAYLDGQGAPLFEPVEELPVDPDDDPIDDSLNQTR